MSRGGRLLQAAEADITSFYNNSSSGRAAVVHFTPGSHLSARICGLKLPASTESAHLE
jgi:hypothetical protein